MRPGVLVTQPFLKQTVWGSDRLQSEWGKALPPGSKLGESWEISCIDGGESGVMGGGPNLRQLYERDPAWFRGEEAPGGAFPLLVKLIATSDVLSLQVHPDDRAAERLEATSRGKHEAWLILEADPGASLYLGLVEGATKDQLGDALRGDDAQSVRELLRQVTVEPGQVFDIAPGTVHAIGPGLVLLEVQQPSDITYRVFDWGRTGLDGNPRELHVHKALEVIKEDARPVAVPRVGALSGMEGEILLRTKDFRMERWLVDGRLRVPVTELLTCVCVGGEGTVASPQDVPKGLLRGRSCVIPRGVSMATFEGRGLDLVVALPPA
jgi:mannose-6-phosphate isomerase